jgi:hypothetical protein
VRGTFLSALHLEFRKLLNLHSLAELVKREMAPSWPEGYFEEVTGGWQGEPLQRLAQGE